MARPTEYHFGKSGSALTALRNGRLSIYETLYRGDDVFNSNSLLNIDPNLTVADVLPSKTLNPEEEFIAGEYSQAVTSALASAVGRLPQKEAEAFTLITLEGFSAKEAAYAMGGISKGKAKYLNLSAIEKLRADTELKATIEG